MAILRLASLVNLAALFLLSTQVHAAPQGSSELTATSVVSAIDVPESTATAVNLGQIGNDVSPSSLNISVPLLPADPKDIKEKSFAQVITTNLEHSLPSVLEQLNVPAEDLADTTEKAATILNDVLVTMFSEHDVSNARPEKSLSTVVLARRGLFDDIGDFVGGVVDKVGDAVDKVGDAIGDVVDKVGDVAKWKSCNVFATLGLSPYLGYATAFQLKNPTSEFTSRDQNFFLYPIHRDLLRSSNIRIHYKAKFPIGFASDVKGATFGRHVYLRSSAHASGAGFTDAFRNQVRLLIHELVHCRQYRSLGWSLPRFGLKYLREFCKAGFSYKKNIMEKKAYDIQNDMDQLLFDRGRRFFQVWREHNLFSALGYPTRKTYSSLTNGIQELVFEKGVLQISGPRCYRYGTRLTIGRKNFLCTK